MSSSSHQRPASSASVEADARVTTIISCPGVRPMARAELRASASAGANENRWFDAHGLRRHWYANLAAVAFALGMLLGGVWIVTEFVRLQRLEACFEAGRRDCVPLDMARRHQGVDRRVP